MALVRDSEDIQAIADATLADARVRAAAGDLDGSRSALRGLLRRTATPARTTEYEARLALVDLDKASHAAGWQATAGELLANASREHFSLYAERARALLE